MGWFTTLPTPIRVSRERWYEKKFVGDAVYKRKRGRSVYEYRGCDKTCALAAVESLTYNTATSESQAEMNASGGGGYLVKQTVEGWLELEWTLAVVTGE